MILEVTEEGIDFLKFYAGRNGFKDNEEEVTGDNDDESRPVRINTEGTHSFWNFFLLNLV